MSSPIAGHNPKAQDIQFPAKQRDLHPTSKNMDGRKFSFNKGAVKQSHSSQTISVVYAEMAHLTSLEVDSRNKLKDQGAEPIAKVEILTSLDLSKEQINQATTQIANLTGKT